MPMKWTLLQTGHGKIRRILIFLPVMLGALGTGLLFHPPGLQMAAGLWANPIPVKLQQKSSGPKTLSIDSSGTTFIYSFQPWGGVRSDNSEWAISPRWDVSTLTSGLGEYHLPTTAHTGGVGEVKNQMNRGDLPPSVQFLRLRNPNWMTIS